MLTKEENREMLLEVQPLIVDILFRINLPVGTISTKMSQDEWSDGGEALIVGEVFSVFTYEGKQSSVAGDLKVARYGIGHEYTVIGVHRYADGSGEPDSAEFADDKMDIVTARGAAREVIRLILEFELDQAIQSIEEEEFAEQLQKDEELDRLREDQG